MPAKKESEGGTTFGIFAMDRIKENKHDDSTLPTRVGTWGNIFFNKSIFFLFPGLG
jgi:hypothetical protein